MSNKIRTGIFGAGFGNYGHFDALKTLPEFEVVAVCGGRFKESLKSSPKVKIYESHEWQKLLQENDLDLAVVAIPPEGQTPILLSAMKKNLAVMVEKPLSLKQAEYEAIRSQFAETKNYSAASFIFPELETWKAAKIQVEQNRLGSLRSMSVDWRVESPAIKNKIKNWKSTSEKGGSALFHFMPHMIHAIQFFGGPVETVSCISKPAPDLGPEMGLPICLIQLVLKNQVPVSINCSLAAPFGAGHRFEIYGSKGSLVLENKGSDYVREFKLTVQNEEKKFELLEKDANPYLSTLDSRTAPLISIYKKFSAGFEAKEIISPSLLEALETQRIILLCEESRQQELPIRMRS